MIEPTPRTRPPRRFGGGNFLQILPLLFIVMIGAGCASLSPRREAASLIYEPDAFRAALIERVPDIPETLQRPPFEVPEEAVIQAERRMKKSPRGPVRVHKLISMLSEEPPRGYGLEYHWLATGNAERTLSSRQGNCVSLASVLVGLGRGLGWPIYYAVASANDPESREYEGLTEIADHMVVVIAARSFRMVIDFAGQVDEGFSLEPIDDLTAYAHLINNTAGQQIAPISGQATEADWQTAANGFRLATQIAPELGRAWNNLGIALTRLGRFEEAQQAYERSIALDTQFGSAERNLSIMQTRAAGQTTISEQSLAP